MAPTAEAISKVGKRSQDQWYSVFRTLELFSHVCYHYRRALFFFVADYASKISLYDTTRQRVFRHYRCVRFCNEKLVYHGWMVNTLSYPSIESGIPLPHLSPTTTICHLPYNLPSFQVHNGFKVGPEEVTFMAHHLTMLNWFIIQLQGRNDIQLLQVWHVIPEMTKYVAPNDVTKTCAGVTYQNREWPNISGPTFTWFVACLAHYRNKA